MVRAPALRRPSSLSRTLGCALMAAGMAASAVAPAGASADFTRSADFTEKQAAVLDALFVSLKKARSAGEAERTAAEIWRLWGDSGSASVNLMMEWAQRAIGRRQFPAALDMLDQVVLLAPDFAEGWNRRATLHFMMENNAKSMADIERVLALEPRHFGALSGMANILRMQGDDALALKAFERVLEVHPMMRAAQTAVGELAEETAGDKL